MGSERKLTLLWGLLLAMVLLGAPVHASTVSVTMHNPSCVQIPLSGGMCAIQIRSVTAIGSDTSFSRVEVKVNSKLRVVMSGFFESSASLTHQMVPGGLKVACGLPNASGSVNLGKAYSVAANAYMFDGTSAGASQSVFCPAYKKTDLTPILMLLLD
jgi:hypothetical protein